MLAMTTKAKQMIWAHRNESIYIYQKPKKWKRTEKRNDEMTKKENRVENVSFADIAQDVNHYYGENNG